jgi:SPASM domain peptide maturase of grasp-with-spasm system
MSRSASLSSGGFFLLFADCIPVRGARRSVLCDLQRRRLRFIPSTLFDILTQHSRQSLEQIQAAYPTADHAKIEEYLDVLVREEYGFWSDEPEHFSNLDLTWEVPARCTNAIIDVSRDSAHDFAAIFEQLDALGCMNLQLRLYDALDPEDIVEMVRRAEEWRFRHVDVIARAGTRTTVAFLRELCTQHHIVTRATLYGAAEDDRLIIEGLGTEIRSTTADFDLDACGHVDPKLFAINTQHFTEARCFNSCLNKKVSIAANGDIMACPSMKNAYGNVRSARLAEVIQQSKIQDLWRVTKDQVQVCKDCEFRYVCTDCRAHTVDGGRYSKPSSCRYNPYTAAWE